MVFHFRNRLACSSCLTATVATLTAGVAAAGEARDPWKNLRADSDPLKTPEAARVGKSSKAARLETRDATYAVDQQGLNDNLDVLLDRSYGAQTAPEREFTPGIDGLAGDKKWRPHIEFTAAPGDERSLGQINLFAPLMQDGDSLLFTDLRASAWTDNVQEGNFGVGYRQLVPGAFFGNDAILGIYGFFDARRSAFDNMFYQGTLGAELITERFEFRVNGYLPSGNQYVVGTTGSGVTLDGFNVVNVANDLVERALPGFDVEAGIKIDFSEAAVRLNAGYFRFERGDTLVEGPRFRAEVEIDDPFGWDGAKLSLGGEVRDDDVRGTEVSGLMRLRVPIGGPSDADRANDQLSELERLMTRRVYRDDDIVSPVVRGENTQAVSQATDAASGETLQAFFVANTAQGAADCSSVANACEFVTAQGLAGAGDTFLPVDVAGNIGSVFTLNADRQQVIGAGATGSASITLSDAAGSVLVVTSLGGRPIVTGVNMGHFADTRVAGLATNSATGIFGDGMTGTIGIQDVITTDGGLRFANTGATISVTDTAITSNAAIGIELTNYTGPGATFTNTDVTTITGAGLRLDGGSGGITLDADSSITKSGAGAAVEVVNAHTGTLRVDGSVAATGGTGLQFNNADGTYNFNGASNLNGGDAGIDILNGSAGTFTFGANTAIMSPTGMAFNVDGSAANVAYQGTIIQNNAANAVSAVNNTGGTVTFSGAVTANTSTATGVNLTNNAGATVSFTGGLDIDTTTGIGFSATGGGTVNVSNGAVVNSVNSTAGQAIDIDGVGGSLTFSTIVSTGAPGDGVAIDNFGAGATFRVTGATTVTTPGQDGVDIDNVAGTVTFSGPVTITTPTDDGVDMDDVTGMVTFAGPVTVTNPGDDGIDIEDSFNATLAFNGPVAITGAGGNGIELNGPGGAAPTAGTLTFGGSTTITNPNLAGVLGADRIGAITFADLDIALQTAGSAGLVLAGATINGNFTATDFDVTSTTNAGTAGVVLSGTMGPGTIQLGDSNVAGANASIAGVNAGVVFNAASNATFIFGDGEGVADKGSAISGTTAIAGGSLVTMGSYDFDDVNFTGILDFTAGAASNLVFVAQTATGDGSGSDVNNRANAATADAITTANTTFVLINDGAAIDDTDGFTLHASQTMASFGNGRTFASSGLVIPANFSGIPGAGPAITDPTGNGAGVLTNSGAGNTLTLLGNDATLQDFEINNAAAGTGLTATGTANISSTGLVVRNVGAQGIDLNNVTGTVTFNNTTVSTTAGNGVDLNNTSATFGGGLNISTVDGIGLNATGGGTIGVSNSATEQVVATGTGTAINLDGVTIAAGGVNFDQVTTAGTSTGNGIDINDAAGGMITLASVNIAGTVATTGLDISGNARTSNVVVSAGTIGNGVRVDGTGAGTVQIGANISKSVGYAVQIANRDGASGAITVGGTVTSGTGAVSLQNNTGGNVTFNGTVTGTGSNTAGAINIDATTGGTATFAGLVDIDVTGAGTGVSIANSNAGGTFNFTGGLDINSVNGTGFEALSGTVSVAATANNESVTTTAGQAVNLDNTIIGVGGISFDSLSSAGSAGRGINLDSVTGGAFTVTGTTSATGSTTQGVRVANSSVAINLGTVNVSGATGDAVFLDSNTGGSFTVTGGTVTKGGVGGGDALDINGGAMAVNFGANVSHTSTAGGAVLIRGGTTGNITVSGTIANTTGGRAVNIDTVTGGAISFTGATVTDTIGIQIADVAAGASVSFSAGTAVTLNSPGLPGINLFDNAGAIAFNGAVDINNARDGGIKLLGNNANVTFGQLDIELSGGGAAANTDAISIANTPGVLTFGATTITNVGAASGQKGVDFSGITTGGTVNFASLNVALVGDNVTALDLSGATIGANMTFGDFDVTSTSATGTVAVNLSGATGAGVVQLGDTNQNGGPNVTIGTAANMLATGVQFNAATNLNFTIGDGDGAAGDLTASDIHATTALGGTLPTNGSYNFRDIDFNASGTAILTGPSLYFVDAAGAGTGASQTDAGSIAGAETFTGDVIVLIDTTQNAGSDTIDMTAAPHISGGAANSLDLDDGQVLISLVAGQSIDLSTLGVAATGAPGNFFFTGIAGGTSTVTGAATLDSVAPTLTTNLGNTVNLAGSAGIQSVTLTNTGGGDGINASFGAGENVVIRSSTIGGGAGGEAINIATTAGASTFDFSGLTLSRGVRLNGTAGGTLTGTATGSNTIANAAGKGLDLDTVVIGAAGFTFDSVSSTNAGDTNSGIRLDTLSGAGAVTITNATVVDSGGPGEGHAIDLTSIGTTGALTIANIDIDLPTTGGNNLRGIISNGGHTSDINLGTGAGGVAVDSAALGILLNGTAGVINIGTGAGSGGVQLNTLGGGINFGGNSTGTINIGTTAATSVIDAGNVFPVQAAINFNSSDATVTVTGINITGAGAGALNHGIQLSDNDADGSFTLNGTNTIDNTGGDGIFVDNATASISNVTIGASATGAGDDISGAGIRIDNDDTFSRTVALSNITMGSGGNGDTGDVAGIGIDINSSGTGVLTVNLTGTNVIRSTGQALDVDETAGVAAANKVLLSVNNTTFESAADNVPSVEVTGQNVSTTTNSVGVRGFAGNTVIGNSSTSRGGILFTAVDFDSDGAGGQVAGGTLNIGQSAGARVRGDGLSLIDTTGDLAFTTLNVFNDNGTGLEVNTKGSGTTFNLVNAGGTVNTTNGTALFLDPLTMNLTFGAVTATGGANGVFIDAGDATGGAGSNALTITTLNVTSSTGAGLRINNSTGTFNFGTTTINNTATAGGGVDIDATAGSGGDTLNVNFTNGLDIDTTTGDGFDANVFVASTFNLQVANAGTETINTTTGRILDLVNTNAGVAGINFDSLTATGVVNGHAIEIDLDSGTLNGGNVTIAGTAAGGNNGIRINQGGAGSFVNFASATIDNVLGIAISMGGDNTVTFATVDIDGGSTGVSVGSVGSLTISAGAIGATTSTTGRAFQSTGGSGTVNIAASLTKSTAAELVRVSGRTGGSITLSGNLSATGLASGINVTGNSGGTYTFSGATKTLNTGANAAVSLTSNTGAIISFTNGGLDIDTTSATGFLATGGGTVNVLGVGNTVDTTSGAALNFSNISTNVSFASATATALNGNNGITLADVFGTFAVSGGTITNTGAGTGIVIGDGSSNSGGNGTVTIATAINSTGATGLAANIRNVFGGTVTLSGNLTDSAATGGGISASGNTGGTINFSGTSQVINTATSTGVNLANSGTSTVNFTGGGLDIDTTSGAGFTATGGGTVTVQGTGNSVTTTTGTAVNIASTTIGGAGVTFQSVASNGATNGIVLNTTGAGAFTVTGTGTTDGSGGTIQNITGNAIQLTSASNVDLRNMNLTNVATTQGVGSTVFGGNIANYNAGVKLTNVTNLTLNNLDINGNNNAGQVGISGQTVSGLTITDTTVEAFGNAAGEDNIQFQGLTGTVNITNLINRDAGSDLFAIDNTGSGGTAAGGNLTMTVTGSTFQETLVGVGAGGLRVNVHSAGTTSVSVNTSTFGNGTAALAAGGLQGTGLELDVGRGHTGTLTVEDSTFNGMNVAISGTLDTDGAGAGPDLTVNIRDGADAGTAGNTITGIRSNAINLFTNGTLGPGVGILRATITDNTIGTLGTAGSGSQLGSGIRVSNEGGGTMTVNINNNTIQEIANFEGIFASESVTGGTSNITITNNLFREHDFDRPIQVANTVAGGTTCSNISGNSFSGTIDGGPFGAASRIIRVRQTAGTHNSVQTSAANIQAVNGGTGVVTETGTINFGQPACVLP